MANIKIQSLLTVISTVTQTILGGGQQDGNQIASEIIALTLNLIICSFGCDLQHTSSSSDLA